MSARRERQRAVLRLELDLPENLGAEVAAGATASYLAFRAAAPKPAREPDHRRHLLRFYVARALARAGYRTLLVRPLVRVEGRRVRVDVAARRGPRVALALCEPEATRETAATLRALRRVECVEVLLVRRDAQVAGAAWERLRARLGEAEIRVVTVALPPFDDPFECDTWVYAELLRATVAGGTA